MFFIFYVFFKAQSWSTTQDRCDALLVTYYFLENKVLLKTSLILSILIQRRDYWRNIEENVWSQIGKFNIKDIFSPTTCLIMKRKRVSFKNKNGQQKDFFNFVRITHLIEITLISNLTNLLQDRWCSCWRCLLLKLIYHVSNYPKWAKCI